MAREFERVKGSQRTDFKGGNAMDGVIYRAGGAGEMKNVVYLAAIKGITNVELAEFKLRLGFQVFEIGSPPSQKIIHRNYGITFG